MLQSKPWQWGEVTDDKWREPAVELYALSERWQQAGRKFVLDLGCGLGRHSLFLADRGFAVAAFDLSTAGIAAVSQAAGEQRLPITATTGDMKKLPYRDKRFDAVVAFNVIYHADRQGVEQTVAEIRRVLADNGEVFLTLLSKQDPSYSDPANRVVDGSTQIKTCGHEAGIPHYYTDESGVAELLAGFEILRFTHVEEFEKSGRGAHYFILAAKRQPQGKGRTRNPHRVWSMPLVIAGKCLLTAEAFLALTGTLEPAGGANKAAKESARDDKRHFAGGSQAYAGSVERGPHFPQVLP